MWGVSAIRSSIYILISVYQTSCALHFTDEEGDDHHIGFVSIKTERNSCVVTNTVRSAGVSLDFTSDSGGVNLGVRFISKSYIRQGDYLELTENDAGVMMIEKNIKSLQQPHKNCSSE